MKRIVGMMSLAVMLLFNFTGCVTSEVWNDSDQPRSTYDERVVAFYISPQTNELIFLGDKYHYFFKGGTDKLGFLLKFKDAKGLVFKVNDGSYSCSSGDIIASFSVSIDAEIAPPEIVEWVKTHDFKFDPDNHLYSKRIRLQGKRYQAVQEINDKAVQLTRIRSIKVRECESSPGTVLENIVLTPVALAADGALIVGSVVLIPLSIFLYSQGGH